MEEVFKLKTPQGPRVPMLLSIPHVGMEFPAHVQDKYVPELSQKPDDTDFYLDQLYGFAAEMGVTTISARYSRWLIDLNRSPESDPLYSDGRMITSLTPRTDFRGVPIYKTPQLEPDPSEVEERKAVYYWPYYEKIDEILKALLHEFEQVIFWDAHSIRSYVPRIHPEKFPPLILGSNEGTTAHPRLIAAAGRSLEAQGHQVAHNHPFKGGNLTRHFGNPGAHMHALQLEMSKELYMDETERVYDAEKAAPIQQLLKNTFERLLQTMDSL